MAKLIEEDPSIQARAVSRDTNELLVWGQGEIHLAIVTGAAE